MALPPTIQDRDYNNFKDNGDGTSSRYVHVVNPGGGGGDATAANQVIGNASLSSIDTKLTAQAVTYSAAAVFTPPATPTDTFRIRGSATKTIKVRRVTLSTTQTTAGVNTFYLIKRITADTGGTLPVATAAPHDSNSAASATVVGYYSVNPTTLGTSAGNIDAVSLYSPTTTSTSTGIQKVWDFNQSDIEPIVLRGVAETLVINFNGAALPAGLSIKASFMWTEE